MLAGVTLTQLEAFVLVARLGSVKAAAQALNVSEPAVSGALAALRQHLGDPLVTRTSAGMTLTGGGQRLVGIASRMINLAAEAEVVVRQEAGAPERLRVVATSTAAEFAVPPLLDALSARVGQIESSVGVATTSEMAALLQERLADVAIGPKLTGENAAGLLSEPMFRYRLVVVAAPTHRLARARGINFRDLAHDDWFVDPAGADSSAEVGALLERLRVPATRIRVFPSQTAALAAAADGDGVAPAISHLVQRDIDHGRLVALDVTGTPIDLLWYVSMLAGARRVPSATALRRFLSTPEAMQAMHRSDGGIPASRFRPPVYVTIWS
ncbi:MAG: transcriptional regulator, LysR family [Ilumatobacteraceae bacterium]|nr:transcriptional regulator, LysR family [Ilumatobacteraceae bacterium]